MKRPVWLRLWHSTTARFALLHLCLALAGMIPVLLYVYVEIDRIIVEDFEDRLEVRRDNLIQQYRNGGLKDLRSAIENRARRRLLEQGAVLLVDPAGKIVAGNLVVWPEGIGAPLDWTVMRLDRIGQPPNEPFLAITERLPSGHRLLIGGLLASRLQTQEALLFALLGAFTLAIPVGLFGSVVMVRQLNRMVDTIAQVGQHVATGDLSRRAPVNGTGEPLDRLGRSLNTMLDRIQALVEELRLVTDALAHDLRSPLMRICVRIDQIQRAAPGTDPGGELEAILLEVTALQRMLDSTLEISRVEAGIGQENFTSFDATELLRDLAEMYRPLAEELGIKLAVTGEPGLIVEGHRPLLARSVANLIDNAIKYGASGRSIELGARREDGAVALSVADRGAGIPAERRDEATQKHRRLDNARTEPGSGLGLALVAAVASLHSGKLLLDDNRPGLRAVLSIGTDRSGR